MTDQFRLLGYADTVGMGVGFLIPVFDQQGSNTLLVQRISVAGTILDFEEVDNIDAQIFYVEPMPVVAGEEAISAFAFARDDIVSGRVGAFRKELAARIDDPALAERPLLSIEVAEYLELAKRRLGFVRSALDRISKTSSKAARDWLDLSILTPDLRSALVRSNPRIGAGIRRVVASIDGNQVIIRGAPQDGGDNLGFELEHTVHKVLRELNAVYPLPRGGWKVRVARSDMKRRTARPEAVVWLADRGDRGAQTYIQDDFAWRVDAYRADELEEFREAAEESETAPFAVLRGRQEAISREVGTLVAHRVTTIEIGSLIQFRSDGPELYRSSPSRAHIHVPAPGFPGTRNSPKAIGATVRQIVAAVLAIEEGRRGPVLEGGWVFFRTAGSGSAPSVDAWATLYDRIWSTGLSAHGGYSLGRLRPSRYNDRYSAWAQEILFPSARAIHDHRTDLEMRKSRMDAAILLSLESRFHQDWAAHAKAVKAVLSQGGWNPSGTSRGPDAWALEIEPMGTIRFVQTKAGAIADRPTWDLADLLAGNLATIDTVAVTCDATAPMILAHLQARGTLVVNMRDICSARAEDGIWSILGAQVRRLSSGQTSRARSHFMALLVKEAFRYGSVDFEEAGALFDAIHGPTLGGEVQLSWSRVRQTPEGTRASVRLLAGVSNQYLQNGTDLIQPFSIFLHRGGITVFRDRLS